MGRSRLFLERLDDRDLPSGLAAFPTLPPGAFDVHPAVVALGSGPGGGEVRVLDPYTGSQLLAVSPFGAGFTGGVNVAVGPDVNGDGARDVVAAAGGGGGPRVVVLDGTTGAELRSFFAFNSGFTGGVTVASYGSEVVVGAGPGGGPRVSVFDITTGEQRRSFFAFDPTFTGGVTVAAGELDGLPGLDIVAGAGPGGGPNVRVFGERSDAPRLSVFAFDPTFTGGVSVAVRTNFGLDGHGYGDVVVGAGPGGSPEVAVLDGTTGERLKRFVAFGPEVGGGVRVAVADISNATLPDILATGGTGAGSAVKLFDGDTATEVGSLAAFGSGSSGGPSVAAGDLVYSVEFPPFTPVPVM